jgi:small subunit ribosomal protein S8
MTDPISDMLTRIKNGYLAGQKQVEMPSSKMKMSLAKILAEESFLKKVEQKIVEKRPKLVLTLAYHGKKPAISEIQRVSRPGRRFYVRAKQISSVISGLGRLIISTPVGLMTGQSARKKSLGGEVICKVW